MIPLRKSLIGWMMLILIAAQIPYGPVGMSEAAEIQPQADGKPQFRNIDLFVAGTEGYHTFRIPTVLTTMDGILLAFAEGRKNSASDTGDIDLVLKRSLDGGTTWEPLQMVCDMGADTCGNPTAVQDESNGRIWLFMNHNYGDDTIEEINNGTSRGVRTIWSSYSDDDGATWSEPVNRFEEVQPSNIRWDATGPAVGIQLRHGPNQGRLVIPAIGRNIQSDDHGLTWYQSGYIQVDTNEATVVELTDGTLMRNDRLSANKELKRRAISTSSDQGATWSPVFYTPELIDPVVQASIVRYMPADNELGSELLLFANPANENVRENMTVRISYDDGATWPEAKTVYSGHSAYSSLTVLPDGTIGLLFEGGGYTPYDKIMFAKFNLAWFDAEEAYLDDLRFTEGSLSPVFRSDIEHYRLTMYEGTEEVTVTPITSNEGIEIEIAGEPAASGVPRAVRLDGLEDLFITARLGSQTRTYSIELDRSRPRPELLLHWDFEQTDDSSVMDVTGKGHTGLLKNGAAVRPGAVRPDGQGHILHLDALQRSHVEITQAQDLHFGTDDFTFAAWVNPETLSRQRHLLMWYGTAGRGVPQWWMSVEQNGAVRMNLNGLPQNREIGIATPSGLVKTGEWTHVAGVRQGGNLLVYVNGELAATSAKFDGSAMNVTNRDAPPFVGFDKGVAANRDWNGSLEDLRIYRHALDPFDVRRLYQLPSDTAEPVTKAVVTPDEPGGLNGWYTSDVTVELTAADGESGVTGTEYRLNRGEWKAYEGAVPISEEGVTTLEYRSRDGAGNVEETRNLTLSIDKTEPELAITPNRDVIWPPNRKWVPVEMGIDAKDESSGISSIVLISVIGNGGPDPGSIVRGAEIGSGDTSFELMAANNPGGKKRVYSITYEARDHAGHKATKTVTIEVARVVNEEDNHDGD